MKAFRRLISFVMALVCTCALLVVGDPRSAAAETGIDEDKESLQTLQSKQQNIDTRLKQIANDLSKAKSDRESVLKQKQLLDQQIALTEEKIENTRLLIEAYEGAVAEKQKELDLIDERIGTNVELISRRLVFNQENGDLQYLSFLLESANISDLLGRVEIMKDLFENDSKILEQLGSDREGVAAKIDELEALKALSEDTRTRLETELTDYERKVKEADEYLDSISNDVATLQRTQREVEASKNQLENDIAALAKQIEEKQRRYYSGGAFIWPVSTDFKRISQFYQGKSHTGIDIPTNYAPADIYASASGTVLIADSHWSYGNYVVIYHGSGMQTLYAHLSKINVKVNQEVKQGEVIGRTGNTGYSFGIHLHFMVYVNGSHVDPLKYVTQPKYKFIYSGVETSMQNKEIFVTEEGFRNLQEELEYLKVTKRKEVVANIKQAISFGDLSENSEYDEAKNEQAEVEMRINEIENLLTTVKIIKNDENTEVVNIGKTVVILDYDLGEEEEYKIVGPTEVDIANNMISDESPLGKALLGKRAGDEASFEAPGGIVKVKLISIS
ncbi:MAG: transcription elongation factor GreA [Clostridia bacterium]|nr:transcription elongation factor GreA [Clostridia bacterium]